MATPLAPGEEIQGSGNGFSISGGTPVHEFGEYTFRAPRPGFFVGDSPTTVYNSMSQPVSTSKKSLDRLDALPTELLCEIFLHLDLCSLLLLRRMHQHVKDAIEDWPSFRTMIAFPKLLAAAEALQCRSWTIKTLLRCIHDERCISCGHFGDLMYLVTPERWCYRCFLKDPPLVVRGPKFESLGQEQADIDIVRRLAPKVRLVPGYYGWRAEGIVREPGLAFDQRALQRLLLDNKEEWLNSKVDKGHPRYYLAMIRAPYWNKSTLRFEEGLMCRACASQGWVYRDPSEGLLAKMHGTHYPIWGLPWRQYSQKSMQDHLKQYGVIFKIQWFGGERRYVHEKPFEQWIWDEPTEFPYISSVLSRCREKEIEFPEGQPFLHKWDHVSSEIETESYNES